MKAIQPYLFFNGNCREAMDFYAQALGSKVDMMSYAQAPNAPADVPDRIMHANISAPDGSALMASDGPQGTTIPEGKNFSLSITCDTRDEQERLFAALSEGGEVTHPLADTFWGAHFGMLQDKFGVKWMLSHHAPQHAV